LSGLDEKLADVYKSARDASQNPDQLKADQINWIKGARACGTDMGCIENAYKTRIAVLSPGSAPKMPNNAAVNSPIPAVLPPQQLQPSPAVASLSDIANKIGLQRSIYCYYAGANLEMKNGYGSPDAAAVGRMVKIAYLRLVNTFPPSQAEAVSSAVGRQMSSMSNDDRLMAPLKCSEEPLMRPYLKEAQGSAR